MTVTEYREKNPNCEYCKHRGFNDFTCYATQKKLSKRTAKKCPCYTPVKWIGDKEEGED